MDGEMLKFIFMRLLFLIVEFKTELKFVSGNFRSDLNVKNIAFHKIN